MKMKSQDGPCAGVLGAMSAFAVAVAAVVIAGTSAGPAGATHVDADRLFGADRFETAAEVVREVVDVNAAPAVVVANGLGFADALAGAALGAPIVLTRPDALPAPSAAVLAEVTDASTVTFVLGGSSAVSESVAEEVGADGREVVRLEGSDRYETAAEIAVAVAARRGIGGALGFERVAFVATGLSPADALAAGPLAYAGGHPVLLTTPGSLPASTAAAISELAIDKVIVLGGPAAVSGSVAGELEALTGSPVARIEGANRYATAVDVADFAIEELGRSAASVLLANGSNTKFADALAGAALGSLVVLTGDTSLPSETADWLDAQTGLTSVRAIGGSASISDRVLAAASDHPPVPDPEPMPDPVPDPESLRDTLTYEVRSQTPGKVEFVVSDTSGRNITTEYPGVAPTLDAREIRVVAYSPVDGAGEPVTTPLPLRLDGVYRDGETPLCAGASGGMFIVVCVAFPLMDLSVGVNFADVPNHAADVSAVLDVLLHDERLVGPIDESTIWYEGVSMGAVTGTMFYLPTERDERIKAIIGFAGFSTWWLPGLSERSNWEAGPPILMMHGMQDETVPYELARRGIEGTGGAPNVTFISVFDAGHEVFGVCPAMEEYNFQWQQHHVFGNPALPDPSIIESSGCAAFGVQEGGTTGAGIAPVPPDVL